MSRSYQKLEGVGGLVGTKLTGGTRTAYPFQALGGFNSTSSVVDAKASVTLTASQSGAVVLLDVASGATVTLPSDAVGLSFFFVVATTVTSNAYKVITASASSYIQGWLGVPLAAGTQKLFFGNNTSYVSLNLNGSTTGGLYGGAFEITCLKSGLWQVNGNVEGSGTVATPFATS